MLSLNTSLFKYVIEWLKRGCMVMDRRGISPVIATVIIVAVAIAISIAVAFWMTGIVGLFTGFEQVQVTSAYAQWDGTKYTIKMTIKNTGTSAATIDNIIINGKPLGGGATSVGITTDSAPLSGGSFSLSPGSSQEVIIYINGESVTWAGGTLTHGVSVEVKLHTASGKEYPKLVVLP